ncbi:hypothetical protein SLS58_003127 [Diplodia intermedia]|uniref:Uncharacterized protein n=1 Tax=Diplodia intermedia TaxID=856260 RepID=A0ABR3TWY9_9PEZI
MLRARPAVDLLVKARPAARMFHQSPKMRSMPKDPHSAHTVSQRIRQGVKAIPVEIYPLGKRAQHFHTSPSFAPHSRQLSMTTSRSSSCVEAVSREQALAEYVECATVAVITLGLSFGVYSFIRPGLEDPTLRLHRSRPDDRH